MIPLTVTAHLLTPPVVDRPVLLDAVLLAGMGARCGASHPSGWVADEEVEAIEAAYSSSFAGLNLAPDELEDGDAAGADVADDGKA